MDHSFIELDKAVVHVIRLVSFLWSWFQSVWWRRIRGLWKLPDGRDWLRGKLGLVLMAQAMLSISLIQFSGLNTAAILLRGQGRVPSLLLDLRPNYGRGNENNCDLLQKVPCTHWYTQCPNPSAGHCWPMPPPETPRNSRASLGQSLVESLFLSSGSWVTNTGFCLCPPRVHFPSPV